MINIQSITDGISRQVNSGWLYTSLSVVNPGDRVCDTCYHNV